MKYAVVAYSIHQQQRTTKFWILLAMLEFGSFFRPFGGVSLRVRVSTCTSQLSILGDQIFCSNGPLLKVALQDLLDARSISGLSRKGGSRGVRRHGMPRHGPPGMVLGSWLRKPHVTSISSELARFQRISHRLGVADFAACCVDNVRARLHFANHFFVK